MSAMNGSRERAMVFLTLNQLNVGISKDEKVECLFTNEPDPQQSVYQLRREKNQLTAEQLRSLKFVPPSVVDLPRNDRPSQSRETPAPKIRKVQRTNTLYNQPRVSIDSSKRTLSAGRSAIPTNSLKCPQPPVITGNSVASVRKQPNVKYTVIDLRMGANKNCTQNGTFKIPFPVTMKPQGITRGPPK